MSADSDTAAFEPLTLRRKVFVGVDANHYSIHTLTGEMREIKADTAYEAFRLSGLKDIVRIERMSAVHKSVVSESHIAPAPASATGSKEEQAQPLRRNAILSADELDALMQAAKKAALASKEQASSGSAMPASTQAGDHPSSMEFAPPPRHPLDDLAALEAQAPATGLDVKNDGFDEIIPSNQQPRAAAAKIALPADEGAASVPLPAEPAAADRAFERELSPDEVEKLLGGKDTNG